MRVSRRSIARVLLGAPLAAAASLGSLRALIGGEARAQEASASPAPVPSPTPAEPEETPLARFLARQEGDLSSDEKRRLRKQIAQMEQALREVRAFVVANDVPPSGTFKALRSTRPGSGR